MKEADITFVIHEEELAMLRFVLHKKGPLGEKVAQYTLPYTSVAQGKSFLKLLGPPNFFFLFACFDFLLQINFCHFLKKILTRFFPIAVAFVTTSRLEKIKAENHCNKNFNGEL